MDWIETKKELPCTDIDVLTWSPTYGPQILKLIDQETLTYPRTGWWNQHSLTRFGDVTHWMPLPSKPKRS